MQILVLIVGLAWTKRICMAFLVRPVVLLSSLSSASCRQVFEEYGLPWVGLWYRPSGKRHHLGSADVTHHAVSCHHSAQSEAFALAVGGTESDQAPRQSV